METFSFKPWENLIERLSLYLIEKNLSCDYSKFTVLFPNKRPKHFLLKYLNKHLSKTFFPPQIFSMDQFVEELFQRVCKNYKKLSSIEGVYLLYDTLKKIDRVERNELFDRFEKFFPYGIKLFQAFEELLIENVKAERLRDFEPLINDYGKLWKVYKEFYSLIEKEGYATRSFMYKKVADLLEAEHLWSIENLIICGFFALTESEKRLIGKIDSFYERGGKEGTIVSLFYEKNINSEHKPEIHVYECPDRHGQVYALQNLLSERMTSEETVVVLPSEELLFPLIKQGLSYLEQKNYNISIGYPLLRTPIWSLFEAIAELEESSFKDQVGRKLFSLKDYLRLVLHPYVKNIKFKGSPTVTRILFHSLENYLKEEEGLFVSLEEIESKLIDRALGRNSDLNELELPELKRHLSNIHSALITPFSSVENIKDFAIKCLKTLEFIYGNSTAPFHPFFFPFYSTFVEKIQELANSLLCFVSFNDRVDYFSFLKNYLKGIRTPFEGLPIRGLQVLGFLETRNLRFKNVFFFDLNEEIFPPILEDFIIPLRVRESLGLPTFEERQRLLEYYFRILIDGAERVFLFYVKDEKREKSRFLERLIWENEKMGNELPFKCIHYKLNLSAQKPEIQRKLDYHIEFLKDFPFSPSSIDMYIKCPLRFYYSYILQLKPKEEVDLDSTQIGSIVHSVLSQFFQRFLDRRKITKEELNKEILTDLVEGEFRKRFGDYVFGDIFLAKRQILKRLSDLIEKYYGEIADRSPLFIFDVESPINFIFEGIKISGIIDIVEKRTDKLYIIDYKTSSREEHYKINFNRLEEIIEEYENNQDNSNDYLLAHHLEKNLRSIQIPLYVLGYSRINNIPPEQIQGRYLILGKVNLAEIEYDPFSSLRDSERAIKLTESLLKLLLSEILNPQIPFYPTRNFKDNCPYCDFRTTCGTLWVKAKFY